MHGLIVDITGESNYLYLIFIRQRKGRKTIQIHR